MSNDQNENFFFQNETRGRGATLRFQERGFQVGLAVDANGWEQACMGVAAGDVNGDGLMDLFITNFYDESNCLYMQQLGHFFIDATRQTGLRDPSYEMLGFGAQFIDGELDGLPDLVLMNGHLDDRTDEGIAYRMRPQYFRNQGGSRFVESAADSLGPFFQSKRLGRGLARLDWNRDGREDFAVSDLLGPSALVTNTTQDSGNFVAVRLRGIRSSRDAIGAQVTVIAGGRLQVQQLVAGDGYQASNQRQLIFGVAQRESIENLEVRWPSGLKTSWPNLEVNEEFLLLEGHPFAYCRTHRIKGSNRPQSSLTIRN